MKSFMVKNGKPFMDYNFDQIYPDCPVNYIML